MVLITNKENTEALARTLPTFANNEVLPEGDAQVDTIREDVRDLLNDYCSGRCYPKEKYAEVFENTSALDIYERLIQDDNVKIIFLNLYVLKEIGQMKIVDDLLERGYANILGFYLHKFDNQYHDEIREKLSNIGSYYANYQGSKSVSISELVQKLLNISTGKLLTGYDFIDLTEEAVIELLFDSGNEEELFRSFMYFGAFIFRIIIDRLISEGNGYLVLKYYRKLEHWDENLLTKLIDAGYVVTIARNLVRDDEREASRESHAKNYTEIWKINASDSIELLKRVKSWSIFGRFKCIYGLTPDHYNQIAEILIERGNFRELADNLGKLSGLKAEVAEILDKAGYIKAARDHSTSFESLPRSVIWKLNIYSEKGLISSFSEWATGEYKAEKN